LGEMKKQTSFFQPSSRQFIEQEVENLASHTWRVLASFSSLALFLGAAVSRRNAPQPAVRSVAARQTDKASDYPVNIVERLTANERDMSPRSQWRPTQK